MEKWSRYLLIILLAAAACNRPVESQDTNNRIPTEDEGRPAPEQELNETNVDDDALIFMKNAANGGTMEVELGKLAQQKGQNPRVKNFGTMMVRDHTQVNKELIALGTEKNVVINYSMTSEQQKHAEELKKLQGAEFDRQYMKMMVKDHEKDIQAFEGAADNRDARLNRFATKTLPVLKMHLDSAKAIHASLTQKGS